MRALLIEIGLVVAVAFGLAIGYMLWGTPTNWYAAVPDVAKLGPGAENDLIRYGKQLIVDTPRHIGKNATDPAMRYAGNNLSCQNCHLNAGLQPFAAPFDSTFATFPMFVDDKVITLTERINGCMRRSLNGKDLPHENRAMEALIAYFQFVGKGTPEGVRIAGMGLRPIAQPEEPPDARRGEAVYGQLCVTCHKPDGQGERAKDGIGYAIPPLWGEASFNAGAGYGENRVRRLLYPGQHAVRGFLSRARAHRAAAWDVAAYMISKPHPPAPSETEAELQ